MASRAEDQETGRDSSLKTSIALNVPAQTRHQKGQTSSDRFGRIWDAKVAGDADYLIRALADPDHRASAARFLAELGVRDAIPGITKLLDVADPVVRAQAAKALGALRAVEVLPRLIDAAKDDDSDAVRSYAVAALGRIGDPVANATLVALLVDPEVWIRRGAVSALALTGEESAIGPLRAASSLEPRWRRRRYAKAIRTIRARSRGR